MSQAVTPEAVTLASPTPLRQAPIAPQIGVGVGVLYSNTTFIRETTPLLQIRQVAQLMEHYMQPARAPRAKEHTNNPVQRPNFRGQGTKQGTPWLDSSPQTPLVHRDNSGQENKRTSVDLARGKVSGGSRQKAVVGRTSLGGSLCREQRHPNPRSWR